MPRRVTWIVATEGLQDANHTPIRVLEDDTGSTDYYVEGTFDEIMALFKKLIDGFGGANG